ncbi:MAG TPA: NAD(P)-binding protein [Deltaproteobacteria bacterium]|jgi:formate dehydrogenase major subunit|nr:NAD(P)-binding protein [Deltaproteobacteria bacterium]
MMLTLTIDDKMCTADSTTTIIDAARAHGISIPALGYDPRVSAPSTVEVAFVEVIEGGKTRFVSATSTRVSEGMIVRTQSDALTSYRRIYLQGLLKNHYGDCVAPCVQRCPANIDIQKYIYHVSSGNFAEALEVIKESNPLPGVCGRVCPHPCESECRRNAVDGAVNINAIKRFVADWDRYQLSPYSPECAPDTGVKVAVVGAGPAGLTAAYFLRRKGHSVTIFEMQEAAGGMLRWGIPYYRLPERQLDEEIRSILDLGVEIRYNKKLGRDFTIESLKRDGFTAVFIGLGAQKATAIGVDGEDLPGVMSGLDFLARLARGEKPDIGERVLVIGGGNTAMDAARSALRLGARDVTIAYRRTRHEMPAQEIEIEEAIEEGVNIQYLTAPVSIRQAGSMLQMTCTRMELGEPDKSGRRRPVPVAGSDFTITANTIISAIGQAVDAASVGNANLLDKWGNIKADPVTMQTADPWVFSGGDCVTGPDIAIAAIGAGRRAAEAIDSLIRTGTVELPPEPYTCSKGSWKDIPAEEFKGVRPAERREIAVLSPESRKGTFDESSKTWDMDTTMDEAARCLACGCTERYGCDLRDCATLYDVTIDHTLPATPLPVDDNHPIITRDPGKCILCGLCLKVCREMEGVSALSFHETKGVLTIGPNDHRPLDLTTCVACGHCASICPTGALVMKPVLPKVYRALQNPELTVVAQIAPAVRAAFAQHYGISPEDAMAVLSAGLKRLGFNFVFDTCWAADLTIMEEGTEFLSRLAEGGVLPQITSCCPAWINYCEKMAPDILPHLSSCKSPQQMFGAVMKQYFARQLKVDPALLYFVSIMPCNAKKYEAARPEFSHDGIADVDVVLTTNDVIGMFSERRIDPKAIEPIPVDTFFGKASGSGVIFGASGGVAEAALRLAAERVTGKRLDSFTYEGVRGLQGVKETNVTLGDVTVRLAVVSGLQNAQNLIDRIRSGDAPYDLIEVMACPGGCINGSGNPAPEIASDTAARLEVLYRLDQEAPVRKSQDNPAIQAIYENWLGQPVSETSHHALHTTYRRRSMRFEEKQAEVILKELPVIDVGVCIGTNCYVKGSWKLLEGLAAELRRRGLSERFRIKARFCTGQCEGGPNVVVGQKIISGIDTADAAGFIDTHLASLLDG